MNWLKKIAQVMPMMPQATLTTDQMMGIINDVLINQGGDINYAEQQFRAAAPLPEEICSTINKVAGVNAAARPKMQVLSEAGGCYWNPDNPPMEQQQQQPEMNPEMMPMIGQQEKPMNMPAVEIE